MTDPASPSADKAMRRKPSGPRRMALVILAAAIALVAGVSFYRAHTDAQLLRADIDVIPTHPGLMRIAVGRGARGALGDAAAPGPLWPAGGLSERRCDLPFRQERRTGPPFPGGAERDRAGLRNAVRALRKTVAGRIFLGGHSYGGRQATMLCAAEPDLAPVPG